MAAPDADTLEGPGCGSHFYYCLHGQHLYVRQPTQSFLNVENLQGGNMADTFTVSAAHTGSIEVERSEYLRSGKWRQRDGGITAGGGDEMFNINAAYTLNLDGLGGADTFNVGAVLTGNIGGGAEDNTYNLNMNGQVDGAITGGDTLDTFVFNGGSVTGLVDGAGGMNTLNYNALSSPVAVVVLTGPSTVGFAGTATGITAPMALMASPIWSGERDDRHVGGSGCGRHLHGEYGQWRHL